MIIFVWFVFVAVVVVAQALNRFCQLFSEEDSDFSSLAAERALRRYPRSSSAGYRLHGDADCLGGLHHRQ